MFREGGISPVYTWWGGWANAGPTDGQEFDVTAMIVHSSRVRL